MKDFKLILKNRIAHLKGVKNKCDWMGHDWKRLSSKIEEAEHILEMLKDYTT